jgi:hypothetical protein
MPASLTKLRKLPSLSPKRALLIGTVKKVRELRFMGCHHSDKVLPPATVGLSADAGNADAGEWPDMDEGDVMQDG